MRLIKGGNGDEKDSTTGDPGDADDGEMPD